MQGFDCCEIATVQEMALHHQFTTFNQKHKGIAMCSRVDTYQSSAILTAACNPVWINVLKNTEVKTNEAHPCVNRIWLQEIIFLHCLALKKKHRWCVMGINDESFHILRER